MKKIFLFSVEDLPVVSSTSLKFSMESPDFMGPIQNVTVAIGREAILSCSVTELGHYKVSKIYIISLFLLLLLLFFYFETTVFFLHFNNKCKLDSLFTQTIKY